jgi:hypothetical protein
MRICATKEKIGCSGVKILYTTREAIVLKFTKNYNELVGGGGVHVAPSKLKLFKYVWTEENDDKLEELDL